MKPSVAITLIIVGGILIALPPIADYLRQSEMAELLAKPEISKVNLEEPMDHGYRWTCLLCGVSMIATSVITSLKRQGD